MKTVTVVFSDSVYQELERLARRKGITLGEELARAITLYEFAFNEVEDGNRLLVELPPRTWYERWIGPSYQEIIIQ